MKTLVGANSPSRAWSTLPVWVALVIMRERPDIAPRIVWASRWNSEIFMVHLSPTEGYDITRDGIYPIV